MKIRDTATGKVFDLPRHVATGLARSKSNTYELVTDEPAPPTGQTDGPDSDGDSAVPTSSSTVAQLKAYAKAHGIDLGGATKKPGIWAAVSAALEAGKPDHDPAGGSSDETGNETGDPGTGQDAGADGAGDD